MFNAPIVIVANGQFPAHSLPLSVIDKAETLICTDGALEKLMQYGKKPQLVIGDMDSFTEEPPDGIESIHVPDQHNTDLEKAINYCIQSRIKAVSIVGATGLRDDHHFANILLLLDYSNEIVISIITDLFTISVSQGKKSFSSFKGQTVSLFSPSPAVITSQNLKYKLKNENLKSPAKGVSNESLGNTFSIQSSEPIIIMQSHRDTE